MTALYYYLLRPKSRREYTLMCCILRWTPSIHHLQQLPMRDYLQVDVPTLYSLGVLSTDDHPAMLSVGKSKEGLSLISIVDETKSPLGRKLLRIVMAAIGEQKCRDLLNRSPLQQLHAGVGPLEQVHNADYDCRDAGRGHISRGYGAHL